MSFILEALRKSEAERQKQSAPGLADTRYKAKEQRRNYWIPLLVLILAANAVAVSFLLLDDAPEEKQSVATAPVAPREIQREPASNIQAPDVRSLYQETVVAPRTTPAPDPKSAKSTPVPEKVAALPNETVALPSYQQLAADGLVSFPSLHVDIHVYSAEPGQRFVFINMNKYREGEVLKEGPSIDKITETGAVLNHQGTRFTLERE